MFNHGIGEFITNSSLKYEVTIVGAGPSGSTAAYLLANFGLKVALIDKYKFPRAKLCGGLITQKTINLLERVFKENSDSLISKNVINYSTNNFSVYFKNKMVKNGEAAYSFHFVDRKIYDDYFLKMSIDKEVDFFEGEEVKRINLETKEIITASGKRIKSNYIIGADGTNGIVRKEISNNLNYNKEDWNKNMGVAIELELNREIFWTDKPLIIFGIVKYGYGWAFPNKDKVLLGIGKLNNSNNKDIRKEFERLIDYLDIKNISFDQMMSKIKGHPVPSGNFIKNPCYNGILLIGDSGGYADPITGEGIYYAHRSAEFAALAIYNSIINKISPEEEYKILVNKFIVPELSGSNRIRLITFNLFNKYITTKMLATIFEKKIIDIVHGVKSYRIKK